MIEAMELSILVFAVWCLGAATAMKEPGTTFSSLIPMFVVLEVIVMGSWAIYLAYIRLTRGVHPRVDIRLRILMAAITGTYTLWAWIILDVNRLIVSKLFYRGEAPVEYAWSSRSKQARKLWEQEQKQF